jgi:starch-binding outer membrane protein, SusD/RagB family
MKKYYQIIAVLFFTITVMSACHKLDVPVESQLTPEVYPTTQAQFNSVMGPIYTRLRSDYSIGFWQVASHSTDESVQPAYGGNWFDGGRFMQMHYHTWDKDNPLLGGVWSYFSDMVGISNQILFTLETAPEGAAKRQSIAEMKTMRAFAYFQLMDLFGNVPLDTVYGSKVLQTNSPRAVVFSFIESQLKSAIPDLNAAGGSAMYGKPNRYVAYTLLAKLYLNATVYTGTAKLNETIAACDSVINASGGSLYALENRATYFNMFAPANGPAFKELIFAIPYDAATSNGYMFHARYDLNRNLGIRYRYSGSTPGTNVNPIMNLTTGNGLANSKPSGPRMTMPEYLAYFNDVNDIRNQQWLSGKQYWQDGSPIMVITTKKGYDQFYTAADGGTAITYHLEFSPTFSLRQNVATFDCGNDEIAWNMGTRNIKFLADFTNITNRNQNNDVPIFRLSDVILMKAEAIQRGGAATGGQTALTLVNSLRAKRTTTTLWVAVTLDDIYAERARELAWECWRRNDMIRFGKFEGAWGLKTNADTYRRIFPIPQVAMTTNPKLVQNTGY